MKFKIEINGDSVNCPLTDAEKSKMREDIKKALKKYNCKVVNILFY